MSAMQESRSIMENKSAAVIQYPHIKADGTPDLRFGSKKKTGVRESTKMECLYERDDIIAIYKIFQDRIEKAASLSKEKIARRNLTMFVCAINVGLRGGDFCSLKWSDILDKNWDYKASADYVPEKTIRRDDQGYIVKAKHIELSWNDDFEIALSEWLTWLNNYDSEQELNTYIFKSQKGENINPKEWWKIMENVRKEAGIKQKIGTHGLRKTMAYQYITNAPDKSQALLEVSSQLGHTDLRITERYACLEKKNIEAGKQRMSFIYDK
ncbi:tyrosine-type recombinase/integrase [Lacrimispora celerecrescens]|nr:tyrosine-type recombinase/integrase [Lacrimispora celerecrescens]